MLAVASAIALLAAAYLGVGVLFAPVFLSRGLTTTDPAAAGSPWSFRLILFPSIAALWPVVLRLWIAALREPRPGDHA